MRRLLLTLGILTLVLLWCGPLPSLARQAFFAHMTMHMGVVAVAAPLLALGIAGERFDPVDKTPRLFAPIPASILEFIAVWAWHAPGMHSIARHEPAALAVEQAIFLLCGLLLWLSAFGGDAAQSNTGREGGRTIAGVVSLLLTSMHMTLLGALLALAPRPLYHPAPEVAALAQLNGLSLAGICGPLGDYSTGFAGLAPLDDQHLGGAIMLLIGGVSYLLGGLWLTCILLRDPVLGAGEQK